MSLATTGVDQPRLSLHFGASSWLSVAFIVAILVVSLAAGDKRSTVYLLSFWHYYLYWLAYRFGAAPLARFKRDAILMKSAALIVLGWVVFSAPLNFASLALLTAGFSLNALGAAALGSDRTYYGYELADLPALRVTRFPYSWLSHPMLIGNVIAYGGLLLHPALRAAWWPLACAHVALNLGLLVMERFVRPLRLRTHERQGRTSRDVTFGATFHGKYAGLSVGLAIGAVALAAPQAGRLVASFLGGAVFCYAYGMYRCYSTVDIGIETNSSEETV